MGDMSVTSKLVLAFVTLLLGAVLVGVIATSGLLATEKLAVNNESEAITMVGTTSAGINYTGTVNAYTVNQAPTGWKSNDCPLTSFILKNASGTTLTLTTDYRIDLSNGNLTLVNSGTTNSSVFGAGEYNATYAFYNYCGDDYINLSWGRTSVNLVAGFFALSLLLISLALFYSVAKETGML